jgi:hypothetical protein
MWFLETDMYEASLNLNFYSISVGNIVINPPYLNTDSVRPVNLVLLVYFSSLVYFDIFFVVVVKYKYSGADGCFLSH